MRLTIDNLDGLGAVDYSGGLDRGHGLAHGLPHGRAGTLKIERVLNTPSLAHGVLCLEGTGLARPVRRGRVVIANDSGATLFTGYLATEPVAVYAGVASEGAVYRLAFSAVSDEWLLDKQAAGSLVGVGLGDTGGKLLQRLVSRLDAGAITTNGLAGGRAVGVFVPQAAATWSAHAGAVAGATYGAYRVLNGQLTLTPAGSVNHVLNDGDGSLSVAALHTAAVKELANDVTVTGGLEATVYWNELFLGDGTTVQFDLGSWRGAQPGAVGTGRKALLVDEFTGAVFNWQRWAVSDPGSHLSLSGGGLTFNGGNGIDGQTALTAVDPVEVAGTIVIELAGVTLTGASAGVLGGLYGGVTVQGNCFAGFNVRQVGGATMLAPMVNGVEVGTAMTVTDGHRYTLRLRLHCDEMQRVMQRCYAMVDGAVEAFGGGLVEAPVKVVFEARDLGVSSNTPVTVLYDGAVSASVAQATFVAANSIQLFGSVSSVRVIRTGSVWVTSTSGAGSARPTGTSFTRLAGLPNEGVDCVVTQGSTAKVTFLPGRVPDVNEVVQVSYRGSRRAVARVADAASVAAEAAGGGVGTARWLGKVVRPAARSSADCRSAARAVLAFSTDRAAAATGTYVATNVAGDVWPGDVLTLGGLQVIVRRVVIEDGGAAPEALTYRMAFANEWAEGLGMHLSEAVAEDAVLPEVAVDSLAVGAGGLPNLQQMTVRLGSGGTSLTVDAGVTAPAGGGFEVRRRDAAFGTGLTGSANGDLVLRSPVRGFSIPRAEFEETFYVRMYDGSVPPLYSEQSVGIRTHLPIG